MKVIGVIPCRYKSSRFPGKPVALICGKPMVWHVWNQARKTENIDRLIVATDDNKIYDVCHQYGIESTMTSENHKTGTDRVAEVAGRIDGDVFVNIQGDEPLIDPYGIDRVISEIVKNDREDIVNAFSAITDMGDIVNGNVVKVITSIDDYALAYSRSPIPYPKESNPKYKRQIGLYAIKRDVILKFSSLSRGYLELSEGVEMFRYLENGYKIKMVEISDNGSIPVDVADDILRVESVLKKREGAK
ncbi:MAG: 3-deoxy-manno-octulosonate cytidylyltransferase [Nitrospirae bacterium]|nr:3-deoxy-manno-octulosonate cytidylyltransferase [Nitrospirota bacterium]MBI3378846.1 3-deoxy-manno-octulosonate cytidylyltransferase [Nitrospirota bacterium]